MQLKTCAITGIFPLFSTTNTQPPTLLPLWPLGPGSHLNMAGPLTSTSAPVQSVLLPASRVLSSKSKSDHPYFGDSNVPFLTLRRNSQALPWIFRPIAAGPIMPIPTRTPPQSSPLYIPCAPATQAFFGSLIKPNSSPHPFTHHSLCLDIPQIAGLSSNIASSENFSEHPSASPSPPPVSIYHSTFLDALSLCEVLLFICLLAFYPTQVHRL